MVAVCRGGSAKSITVVMPYLHYSRQSKKKGHRGAITATMLANLMVGALDLGADTRSGHQRVHFSQEVAHADRVMIKDNEGCLGDGRMSEPP